MKQGILYSVATPIGNLGDMTFRAVDVLRSVDEVICEDTRNTKRLLDRYEIETKTTSLYGIQKRSGSIKPVPRMEYVLEGLLAGKNMALVTDAGTPGLSDPGNQLIEKVLEKNVLVVPVPGASALTSLISVSGVDLGKFSFFGFPPHKKGRETFFREVVLSRMPVIYYDSPHRLIKNLTLLEEMANSEKIPKKIVLGRELTKIFEEIVRSDVSRVREYFQENPDKIKGEFVLIAYNESK